MTSDADAKVFERIAGGTDLFLWLGRSTNFHDAAILSLSLERFGPSRLVLHTWDMAVSPDAKTYDDVRPLKQAVVTFWLEEIIGLELDGFASKNVIDELRIERMAADASQPAAATGLSDVFQIVLEHCYGLSGRIQARKVWISFVPATETQLRSEVE